MGGARGPKQAWATDWMHNKLFDGRRLWVLTVVDTWIRICPVMRARRKATAMLVIDAFEEARRRRGLRHTMPVDRGCQLTSNKLDVWSYSNGVMLDFSRPGKPTHNAYVESFNASAIRMPGPAPLLDLDARQKIEDWRRDFNEVRPPGAIGNKTPMSLIHAL